MDLTSYRWYKYTGERDLVFDQNRHNSDYELHIYTGDVFGVRFGPKTAKVIHRRHPDIVFTLYKAEAESATQQSEGWSGTVRKVKVQAGKHTEPPKTKLPGTQSEWETFEFQSSNLASAFYNKKTKVLRITFFNKAVWDYYDVSAKDWRGFKEADSQGKYFNIHIKHGKHQERVE